MNRQLKSSPDTLQKMNRVLTDPPYNYIIHTSSFPETDTDHYHWHIRDHAEVDQGGWI